MANGEIVYLLAQDLKDHLQDKMADSVPAEYQSILEYTDADGDTRVLTVPLVKIGRLQDDPTTLSDDVNQPSIYVAIHPNDPDDTGDGWKHGVASAVEASMTNLGVYLDGPREIGGTEFWWRRFTVAFEAYFIDSDQTQEEACRLANLVRAMLERYCGAYNAGNPHGWGCGGLQDSFNETALQSHVAKSHCWEGGGPDDDYIWRGAVWLQVLTTRE